MDIVLWVGGIACAVIAWWSGATIGWCVGVGLTFGWCVFLSWRRLAGVEVLLATPLEYSVPPGIFQRGSKRIDAIKRAIVHLKLRGEATEGAGRTFSDRDPFTASFESEEELLTFGQRELSELSGAGGASIIILDEKQEIVAYGPLGESLRYRNVIERLYGGYLRSGRGSPEGTRHDPLSRSVFGGFSELGFYYSLVHPLSWESHGVSRRGLCWVGYSAERPPSEGNVEEFYRLIDRLNGGLRVVGAIATVSERAREAVSSDARKSEFLAHISHDIRSPLNTIRAVLSLLKVESTDPRSTEIIDVALRNCDGVGELVGDILDFTRFKEGRLQPRAETIVVREIVEEVVQSFDLLVRQKGLDVVIVDTFGSGGVEFDRRHLRRVVSNLIGNAIKYTERGVIRIELRGEGDSSILVVEDSGIGMTSDEVVSLFTPFSRFGDRRTEGVGLGLTVTKALLEANGGSIEVRSTPYVGSTFTVTFGQRAAQLAGNEADGRSSPGLTQVNRARMPTVLLVDDDRDSCASLARALSGFPVETLVATTVPEGMSLFNFAEPDVVVTDLGMPLGGGERLIDFVHASGRKTPIYCLSGASDGGREIGGRVQGVFQKPVDVRALWCAIEGAGSVT